MDTLTEIKGVVKDNDFEFEFSIDHFNEVEYVELTRGNVPFVTLNLLLNHLVSKNIVLVDERTKGYIEVKDGKIHTNYEICSQVGEDWNDDVWGEVRRIDTFEDVFETN